MRDKSKTPHESLIEARRIALENGLRYVYVGNVNDLGRQSTYCSGCGERLIGRDWYSLSEWHLDAAGKCLSCGTALAGVFEPKPGSWGARRLPVDLGRMAAGAS
jgi:pyruvate formate lyase activating enzyme